MWRSLIPAERLEGLNLEERGNYWFGPGRTLITYWVRPKKLYSILASVPAHEVQRESWDDSGDISEMLRSFDDAEPRARKMLEQCGSVFITGMYYRDPIDNWTSGRVTLLGDAAHPMVPFLAAGAGQSIEDAWTFARVLSRRQDDIPGALLEYQQRRLPRTTRIQAGARAAVKLMHEQDSQRVRDRNGRWKGMARIDPLAETSWGLAWAYNVVKAVEGPPGEVLNVTGLREGKRLRARKASAPSISGSMRSGPRMSRAAMTACARPMIASSPRISRCRMASTPSRTNSATSRRGACRRRMRRAAMSCCISTAAAI